MWHAAGLPKVFDFTAAPEATYTFELYQPVAASGLEHSKRQAFKRRRPLFDVDGGTNAGKKKRRLRLDLVTSRLSRPFSAPATNIIVRASSRSGRWPRRFVADTGGHDLLRRIATINSLRKSLEMAKQRAWDEQERERERLAAGSRQVVTNTVPRWNQRPLAPSPLRFANYDALDLEDEDADEDEVEDDVDRTDEDGCEGHVTAKGQRQMTLYSDFSVMDALAVGKEGYEYLDELDGLPRHLSGDV